MVLLPNATVQTSRSVFSSGNTAPPSAFATFSNVHVMPTHEYPLKLLPETALTSDLVVRCDSGTDIQINDIVTSIVTTYPSLNWPENPPNPNEYLAVVAVAEGTPGIWELAYRDVFVKRSRIGGGAHTT
jgi:hypothetical protein